MYAKYITNSSKHIQLMIDLNDNHISDANFSTFIDRAVL